MPDFTVVVEDPARQITFFDAYGIEPGRHFSRNADGHLQTTVRSHPQPADNYLDVAVVAAGPANGATKMTVQVLDGKQRKGSTPAVFDSAGRAYLTVAVGLQGAR